MKHYSSHTTYSRKAFTLVELLVVIAIMAVLAALVSAVAMKMFHKSKVAAKTNQYKQLHIATESYAAENGWKVCPAKNGSKLWTIILGPYLSDRGNKEEIFIDPLWKDYNSAKPWLTGIGMAYQHLLPESGARNVFWNEDDDKGSSIRQTSDTEQELRILMGDSTNWFLNKKKIDATRHKDGTKGMFLLFDGSVHEFDLEQARASYQDPENLEFN